MTEVELEAVRDLFVAVGSQAPLITNDDEVWLAAKWLLDAASLLMRNETLYQRHFDGWLILHRAFMESYE